MTNALTILPERDHLDELPAQEPRTYGSKRGLGDGIFHFGTGLTGLFVLAIMGAVGIFLSSEAAPALQDAGFSFLTESRWEVDRGQFGVAALLFFTVCIGFVAIAVSFPIAICTALFITEVAPVRLRSWLVSIVDLMAAVPSVVYGLWGFFLLSGHLTGVARWITTWFGWIPIFDVEGSDTNNPLAVEAVYTGSTFIAGLVVAMMVIPIQTTVMREVFSQVPAGEREGAYALGSTRWGMIRAVALPFGRGGIIGGTMLGLGRALGETIAVFLIFTPRFEITTNVLESGTNSISAHIALRYSEASEFGISALLAAGVTLFALTLVVNLIASYFIKRSRSGASSDA